jgi:hypothetical protein
MPRASSESGDHTKRSSDRAIHMQLRSAELVGAAVWEYAAVRLARSLLARRRDVAGQELPEQIILAEGVRTARPRSACGQPRSSWGRGAPASAL